MKPTMNFDHPNFGEFITDLSNELLECRSTHETTRRLLAQYDADIDSSLAFFQSKGGYCDCEILMNVKKCNSLTHSRSKSF